MGTVFATENCRLLARDGLTYPITVDQPWDADDPLVRRHPDRFSDEPTHVMRTVASVEQATAAPGERRRR